MAVVTVCGFGCGIVTNGATATAANRHWSTGSGVSGISLESTTVRTVGGKSVKFAAISGSNPYLYRSPNGSPTVAYQRVYFQFSALPSAATPSTTTPDIMYCFRSSTTANSGSIRLSNAGVISACWNDAVVQSGPTLAAATWYGIEVEWDLTANPNVCRWRVWDAVNGWRDQTNATNAVVAGTVTDFEIGFTTSSGAGTHPTAGMNLFFTDVILGEGTVVGADYSTTKPRAGTVPILRPTSDGTHTASGSNFLHNAAGTAITSATTDVWTLVDDADQTSQADFVNQALAIAQYVEVVFLAPPESAVGAVGVTSAHHGATTSGANMSLRANDGSETQLWAAEAIAATTPVYLHKVMAAPPSGGSWTPLKLAATRIRWGYSTDATPDVYWDSVSYEYEAPYVSRPPRPRPPAHVYR